MNKDCCKKEGNALAGMWYGILPHGACILFIVFSVFGATFFASALKPFFVNYYFLIFISLFFATASSIIYLKRNQCLCFDGILKKKKYLSVLYGSTLLVNAFFLLAVFPVAANINSGLGLAASVRHAFNLNVDEERSGDFLWAEVDIPCSGHSFLVSQELEKLDGVKSVAFRTPNVFKIECDFDTISKEEIASLEIFKTYSIEIIEE